MKTILLTLCVTLLNGAILYPLWLWGIGRRPSLLLVLAMALGGVFCLYLLVRYRRELR